MADLYSWDDVKLIRQYPHLLGLISGKDKLTELHSEWMRYLLDSEAERVLQAHRGSYKTTCISEVGTIWYLMWHPNARIAIIRKSYTGAAEIVRNISNIMMSPEVYSLLEMVWGEKWKFTVKREGKLDLSVKKTKTKEVSITALGIDSGITGSHFDFAISDDVIDLKDRVSEAEREKTKLVLQEFRANIMDRGRHMVHIGTPWNKNDAFTILPPAAKYPIGVTKLITPEEEKVIRSQTTPTLFAINYELKFENEDDLMFRDPRIGKWQADKVTNIRAHVDAAFDGDHYCALTILGQLPGGKFNAVGFVYAGNIKDWYGEIAKKLSFYNCKRIYMEDNADKGYLNDTLKLHPLMMSEHIWTEPYHESMNKHVKISTYALELWPDIEWAEETDIKYLEQCIDYREKMEPDDAPDSLASLIREGAYSSSKNFKMAMWNW